MSTIKDNLEYRYKQAEFFNTKVRETTDPFEASCYFTAFASIFRSVFQQSEKALRLPEEDRCWNRILNPWMASKLSVPQQECERLLKAIRNKDIHVEAITVGKQRFSGNIFGISSLAPPFSSEIALAFEDSETGKKHRIGRTCNLGLGIIRKLLDDHFP
jgi:hypothetical protein